MTAKSWVIWIIVLVLVIGAGFGGYWYFFMRGKVSADVDASASTSETTKMSVKAGWNFVSFPGSITTITDIKTKLGTTSTLKALYRYSGGAWVDVLNEGTVRSGVGYLAYFTESADIDLGASVTGSSTNAEVELTSGWNLVGNPLPYNVQFRSSSSTSTNYIPYTAFSIKLTDGTTGSVLEALSKGYLETPLFLENANPSYSYVNFYDLSGNFVPAFSAFWVKPNSTTVSNLVFSTTGQAVDETITRDSLEGGTATSSTATTSTSQ